jgi:hypothetical protein
MAALSRIYAEERTTEYTKRTAVPRILEEENPSLDGNWNVKQVIWVRPTAWLQLFRGFR